MGSIEVLEAVGRELNAEARSPALPSLYFFTDPSRTPDPVAIANRMPAGSAVVYRHFGASDRLAVARRLSEICAARDVILLIGADPDLARDVGALGVHRPERHISTPRGALSYETCAAHSAEALALASAAGLDAAMLGPVFATRSGVASGSGRPPLGLAEANVLANSANLPVIALGGINARNAHELLGRGFAGLAAVDAFLED